MYLDTYYKDFIEGLFKRGIILILLLLVTSIIIAICQSHEFASSLWVIIKVGVDEWYEYLSKMVQYFVIWAIVTATIFIIQFIIANPLAEGKNF